MNYGNPNNKVTPKYCPRCGIMITGEAAMMNGFLYHPWCRDAILRQMPQAMPEGSMHYQNNYSGGMPYVNEQGFVQNNATASYNRNNSANSVPYNAGMFQADSFRFLQESYVKEAGLNPDSQALDDIRGKLMDLICVNGGIYVLYDKDFNCEYPFITLDGAVEVFTHQHLAHKCCNHYMSYNTGHTEIRQIGDASMFFSSVAALGVKSFKINNGGEPVSGDIKQLISPVSGNYVESENITVRGELLKELQYAYRIRNMHPSQRGGKLETRQIEAMVECTQKAYEALDKAFVYVLSTSVECLPGQVMCTAEVREETDKMATTGSYESLAEEIKSVEFNGSVHKRRILNSQGDNEDAICVYTNLSEAAKALSKIPTSDPSNCIIITSFKRLVNECSECNYVLIDSESLGYKLPVNHFLEVISEF